MPRDLGTVQEIMEAYMTDAIIERGEEQLRMWGLFGSGKEWGEKIIEYGRTLPKQEYVKLLLDLFAPTEDSDA